MIVPSVRHPRVRRWCHYASWFFVGACTIALSVNYFVFDPRKCIEEGGLMDAPPCVSGVILLVVLFGSVAYLLPWVVLVFSSPFFRWWWPDMYDYGGDFDGNGGDFDGNGGD